MGNCVGGSRKQPPCLGSRQTAPEPKQLEWPVRLAPAGSGPEPLTMKEIVAATDNFVLKKLLGEGWFGRVYKGTMPGSQQEVAVKRLVERTSHQGNIEFRTEVAMLGILHHPNLVTLLGYCADGNERVLVYEYLQGGSLDRQLHDRLPDQPPLDWLTRVNIALDAARGLCYLHEGTDPPIIYRDFKTSNILLDSDMRAKIADFGLARVVPVDHTHLETRVMGTWGYVAPEYMLRGKLTQKSDVYSFGVVLLELISGRKAIDKLRPKSDIALTRWAHRVFRHEEEDWMMMGDPALQGQIPPKALRQALTIAFMCLQEEPNHRPLSRDTVRALEQLVKLSEEELTKSPDSQQDQGLKRLRRRTPAGSMDYLSRGSKALSPSDSKASSPEAKRERSLKTLPLGSPPATSPPASTPRAQPALFKALCPVQQSTDTFFQREEEVVFHRKTPAGSWVEVC